MAEDEKIAAGAENKQVTLAEAEAMMRNAKTAQERIAAEKLVRMATAAVAEAQTAVPQHLSLAEAEAMLRNAKTTQERVAAEKLVRMASDEAEKAKAAVAAEAQVVAAKVAEVKKHIVQKGESLSLIAKQYYGDVHKWKQIYEANKAVVGDNPDLIKPGQELVIP